tara:strand:- start:138 stop:974 length:837 start_codon:yes stop_codon:yes gene_type:complete
MKSAPTASMKTISTRTFWLYSLLFIYSLLFSANGLAQRGNPADNEKPQKPLISQEEYNKLLMWLVDEKYENVLYKCIRYTEDDDTKKLPLPYIRMAQAYLGIHQTDDNELREKFEADKNKALKNSLKYASKYRKKDKELEHYHEFAEFFDALWSETKNAAETEMDNEKYTKAKSYYKYLCTIDPDDPGATLMLAAVYQQLKSRKEAELTYEKARNLLLEFGGKGLREIQADLLHFAIIYNVEILANVNRPAALEWLELGSELFRGEPEFEAVRRSIGG